MIKFILKASAVIGVSLALSGSVAFAETGSGSGGAVIDTTGEGSSNVIKVNNKNNCKVKTINNVGVANKTKQNAKTGNVKVKKNTTAGSAVSGAAENRATAGLTLDVANPSAQDVCGCACGTGSMQGDLLIGTTGHDSYNKIIVNGGNKISVTAKNNVEVKNKVDQTAKSGNVSVTKNTEAGDAQSGDAKNESMSEFTINVSNF